MSMPFVFIKKAKTRLAAIDEAMKMCTCKRKSFSGVRYMNEEREEFFITWKEVDEFKTKHITQPPTRKPAPSTQHVGYQTRGPRTQAPPVFNKTPQMFYNKKTP